MNAVYDRPRKQFCWESNSEVSLLVHQLLGHLKTAIVCLILHHAGFKRKCDFDTEANILQNFYSVMSTQLS